MMPASLHNYSEKSRSALSQSCMEGRIWEQMEYNNHSWIHYHTWRDVWVLWKASRRMKSQSEACFKQYTLYPGLNLATVRCDLSNQACRRLSISKTTVAILQRKIFSSSSHQRYCSCPRNHSTREAETILSVYCERNNRHTHRRPPLSQVWVDLGSWMRDLVMTSTKAMINILHQAHESWLECP